MSDSPTNRGASGRGGYQGAKRIAQWFQALPMCAEVGDRDGAVHVAGRGRSPGDHESPAGCQQQVAEHSGAGPIHR